MTMISFYNTASFMTLKTYARGVVFFCLITSALFLGSVIANAEDAQPIIPHCAEFLANADSFYEECNSQARPFSRTFYPGLANPNPTAPGVQEQYSVLFSSALAGSHFLMGCVKNRANLAFLGIYYTLEPTAITQANVAPIMAITADGVVVLSVDNKSVTFTPVRPFDTDKVKTKWNKSPEVNLNCVPSLDADGYYNGGTSDRVVADFSQYDSKHLIKIGNFPSTQTTEEYVEFFPSSHGHDVIYHEGLDVIVESTGAVLVKKSALENRCKTGIRARVIQSPMLIHQICRMTNNLPTN